jgi:acetyl esterase
VPLDPAAAPIIEILDAVFPRITGPDTDAKEVRAQSDAMPKVDPTEAMASVEDRTIPGPAADVPVRIYTPDAAADGPVPGVVYLHGGGWVICGLDSHDNGCRRLANELGAVVVSVDYRLAPEHKHPAAADDAWAALLWTAEHVDELGIDPARLTVAGDSAGGNLAAVVAQRARDRGGPPLAFQLLIYPVIDSSDTRSDHPSKTENATGYFLTTAQMEWFREQYLPHDEAGSDPDVSPHLADSLAGLPPACIVTAEMDPLRDEAEHYAAMLEAAGVPVVLYRAPGMFHGFFNMDAALEGSKHAQRAAFAAALDVLARPEASDRGAGTLRRSEPGPERPHL